MEQPEYPAEAVQPWSRAVVLVPTLGLFVLVGALFPPLSRADPGRRARAVAERLLGAGPPMSRFLSIG